MHKFSAKCPFPNPVHLYTPRPRPRPGLPQGLHAHPNSPKYFLQVRSEGHSTNQPHPILPFPNRPSTRGCTQESDSESSFSDLKDRPGWISWAVKSQSARCKCSSITITSLGHVQRQCGETNGRVSDGRGISVVVPDAMPLSRRKSVSPMRGHMWMNDSWMVIWMDRTSNPTQGLAPKERGTLSPKVDRQAYPCKSSFVNVKDEQVSVRELRWVS